MARLFIDPSKIKNKILVIEGDDHHYLINVLRLKTKDKVELRDGKNKKYLSFIQDLAREKSTLRIEKELEIMLKVYSWTAGMEETGLIFFLKYYQL